MKIISILNQKGGTGKTTIAVNLGKALTLLKKKVLLIDLDPQGNLTYSLGINPEKGTMAEVIHGIQTLQAILVNAEGMDVAPCSRELADIEISLVSKMGREQKLKQALKPINKYDYVFIDCPPSLSILSINALTASESVIIPLQMEILSLQAVTQILSTISEVKKVLARFS